MKNFIFCAVIVLNYFHEKFHYNKAAFYKILLLHSLIFYNMYKVPNFYLIS